MYLKGGTGMKTCSARSVTRMVGFILLALGMAIAVYHQYFYYVQVLEAEAAKYAPAGPELSVAPDGSLANVTGDQIMVKISEAKTIVRNTNVLEQRTGVIVGISLVTLGAFIFYKGGGGLQKKHKHPMV